MEKLNEISITPDDTILFALKKMDSINRKLLLVHTNGVFYSLLSIGDIQRAILANINLTQSVNTIVRSEVRVSQTSDDLQKVKERMRLKRNEFMPIVDAGNKIVDIIYWEDLFKEKQPAIQFNLPVVIMAGGKGSRLKPLTNVLPKPLIPINSKTIIEDIMDRFVEHGCHQFYLSVNYKAELIRYYFDSLNNREYSIDYFQEDNPLGTAGSLSLLKGKINQTFFVSNCDILIDQDYSEILKYHRENKNEITIVAALKHYPIPYGTIKTGSNGLLLELTEKPELTFKINSGMYVIEPHALNEIPENEFYHITDLINKLICNQRKVGVFPINEGSWTDIGNWKEYLKYVKD
jgi:dTDP-glucose pyrophosphorylase